MWSPRHVVVSLFLCLLAVSLLFGCRAFEPEAIIVNRPPETYIIGSPAETSGAYFHFHVYWYGTDADGFVDRYVWALTDTTIQDIESDDDEEDQNFNPATNAGTLAIGTYTSRTDTVFDFQIGQGSNLSYDMTLHMVAIDDRGDYDRTPARLHFFSNALGNPEVEFLRLVDGSEQVFANNDTIAFGEPLILRWRGTTPNLAAYDPGLLAERDTVPPFDDGLLGFKWRLPVEFQCNDAEEDCWNPRAFDEATGDSFSYFGDVTELVFLNDGSGDGPFGRVLDAGIVTLMVNTLDVAGVQVPTLDQTMLVRVNYEPDSYLLDGQPDPVAEHNDDTVYPTYTVFYGDSAGTYSFSSGDTVPDQSYVTFKAMGWDDPRDDIVNEVTNEMTFQGRFFARQFKGGNGPEFSFFTNFSDTNSTREWMSDDPADWEHPSADTLGFMVGPFKYDVVMRSRDEQLTADGTPDTLSFVGGFPPCVQAIEVGSIGMTPNSAFDDIYADNCYDSSLDELTELTVFHNTTPGYDPGDPTHVGWRGGAPATGIIWVNPSAGAITTVEPGTGEGFTLISSYEYHMVVWLHGKDHYMEAWKPGFADRRMGAWRYQIDYDGDPGNALADGVGRDNLSLLTGFPVQENPNNPNVQVDDLFIDRTSGAWAMVIKVAIPQFMVFGGPGLYWSQLLGPTGFNCPAYPAGGTDDEILAWQALPSVQEAYKAWHLTTAQLTPGTISAIAVDQSTCEYRPDTNKYHFYTTTRVPRDDFEHGRSCQDGAYEPNEQGYTELGTVDLQDYALVSNDGEPVRKRFHLRFRLSTGEDFEGGVEPPNWITPGKSRYHGSR